MIVRLSLIALGGAAGAVCRHTVGLAVARLLPTAVFPLGTLVVNIVGSFALGVLFGLGVGGRLPVSDSVRAFAGIGFLGAFTTFSTFSVQTLEALEQGHPGLAVANAMASVVLALTACWLGWALGARW